MCAPLTLARTRPCACGRPDPAVNPIPCPTNRRSADARLPCAADHPDPDRAGRVRLHVPRPRFVAKGLRRGDHNQAEPARPGQAVPVLQRWRAHDDDCPGANRQRHQDRCHQWHRWRWGRNLELPFDPGKRRREQPGHLRRPAIDHSHNDPRRGATADAEASDPAQLRSQVEHRYHVRRAVARLQRACRLPEHGSELPGPRQRRKQSGKTIRGLRNLRRKVS